MAETVKKERKPQQTTMKRHNQGDHQSPGRGRRRILRRKPETFRMSFVWGQRNRTGQRRGRGASDANVFQPNKHKRSIHPSTLM